METVLGKDGEWRVKLYGYRYVPDEGELISEEVYVNERGSRYIPAVNKITNATEIPKRNLGQITSTGSIEYVGFYTEPSVEKFLDGVAHILATEVTMAEKGLDKARIRRMKLSGARIDLMKG